MKTSILAAAVASCVLAGQTPAGPRAESSVKAASPASTRPVIVCLGDSITFGSGLKREETYPARLQQLLPDYEVVNAGIGGNTSQAGLARLERDVLVHKPKIVVMLFGTNDSVMTGPGKYRVACEAYAENLRRLVAGCRASGARVVILTLPAIMPEPYFTRHPRACYESEGGLEKILLRYREAAQTVAASLGAPVVDLYPTFKADTSLLRGPPDGVHPNARGAAAIASQVAKTLAE